MDALLDDGLSLLRLALGKQALRGNEGEAKRCVLKSSRPLFYPDTWVMLNQSIN